MYALRLCVGSTHSTREPKNKRQNPKTEFPLSLQLGGAQNCYKTGRSRQIAKWVEPKIATKLGEAGRERERNSGNPKTGFGFGIQSKRHARTGAAAFVRCEIPGTQLSRAFRKRHTALTRQCGGSCTRGDGHDSLAGWLGLKMLRVGCTHSVSWRGSDGNRHGRERRTAGDESRVSTFVGGDGSRHESGAETDDSRRSNK